MKILADLIKIESISGNETEIASFLLKHLTSLGLHAFIKKTKKTSSKEIKIALSRIPSIDK